MPSENIKKPSNKTKKAVTTAVTEVLRQAIQKSVADGKTYYRLSKESGVRSEIIARFVQGERDIRGETLDALASSLGMELKPKTEK
jgi:hypothetical protein